MRRVTTRQEVAELFAHLPTLFTSRYANKELVDHPGAKVGITVGRPRFKLAYPLAGEIRSLAPSRAYFGDPEPVFRAKYRTDLERRGGATYFAHKFAEMATKAGNDVLILLCFEDLSKPGLWCHRRLFAEWWLEQTGQTVEEVEKTIGA